jgi:hypothetical protein
MANWTLLGGVTIGTGGDGVRTPYGRSYPACWHTPATPSVIYIYGGAYDYGDLWLFDVSTSNFTFLGAFFYDVNRQNLL